MKTDKNLKIMTTKNTFKNIINLLGMFILIVGVTYAFLALCNWNLELQSWTRFSRFILGFEGIIFLIKLIDEL